MAPANSVARTPFSIESFPSDGPDREVLNDLERSRQRTGPEHDGKIVRLLHGKCSGDLRAAPCNTVLDHRCRIDRIIKHDRHALLNVVARNSFEFPTALPIKCESTRRDR